MADVGRSSHYEALEVAPNATPGEIKSAYRRLSLVWHPDRPTGSSERFVEIARAYEVLSDPRRRVTYDRVGTPPTTPRPTRGRSDLEHVAATVEELDAMWNDIVERHRPQSWWQRLRAPR